MWCLQATSTQADLEEEKMEVTLAFMFVALLLIVLLLRKQQKPLAFPGPREWPIVGCYFEMRGQNPVQLWTEWAKCFGQAYRFSLFGKRVLVVSHPETIFEVLVSKGKAFGGRPTTFPIKEIAGNTIVLNSNLAYTTTIRKFVHPSLNTFGAGRGKVATVLKRSTQMLLDNFERTDSKPFDPKNSIYDATTLTVALLLYGDNDVDTIGLSQQLLDVNQAQMDVFGFSMGNALLGFAPWLRHLPWFPPYGRVVRCKRKEEEIFGAMAERISEISSNSQEMTLGKALIDAVGTKFGKGETAEEISMDHVKMVIRDLMSAGAFTTSNTFHALLNILQHHQDIQEKAYREIVTGVGLQRAVEMDDKETLPYNRAIVLEILRYFSVAAVTIVHRTLEDTTLAGIPVPKDTEVIGNLWACHHDPELWTEPWVFRPERFLDDDGQLVPPDHTNRKQLFPFGAGTRVCVGEVIALNRLFVFLTNCLQRFHFLPPEDADASTCDARNYELCLAMQSASYKTRATRRRNSAM